MTHAQLVKSKTRRENEKSIQLIQAIVNLYLDSDSAYILMCVPRVEILLVILDSIKSSLPFTPSGYGLTVHFDGSLYLAKQDKLRPDGPLGSNADFVLYSAINQYN